MDSSATSIHHFNLLQIHHLAFQHYTPRTLSALLLDAHYRLPVSTVSILTSIVPNVWLITSLQFTVLTGITLVCPEGPTKLITMETHSISCNYHQPAVLHHHIFIYHHIMNLHQQLLIFLWI